jgi:selenium metabolism protein YedF
VNTQKGFGVKTIQLACPGPVLKLRDLLEAGEREIALHVADELSRSNVTRFAASRGAKVEVTDGADGSFVVAIRAGGDAADARPGEEVLLECEVPDTTAGAGPRVVQITAATMGSGDDELGAFLLRSFVKTQAELDPKPDAILFYNDGVKLCCEGSTLLDDLRELEAAGVEIIACGTCLNFFELADQLRVGRVTDMLEIAGRLADAGSIVRP